MKKTTATKTATAAEAPAAAAVPVKPKPSKIVVVDFDPKTAVEIPHDQLYAHAATGRTVGFHQPEGDRVALFGVNCRYIATVAADSVPAIEIPPASPPSVLAAVDGKVVQIPISECPPAS